MNRQTDDDLMGWARAIIDGDRRAIARALTAIENSRPQANRLLEAISTARGNARIIGITGPPGVGKSTLVGACITELRRRDLSVGILAVDPSSPISGGALLGDRVRMQVAADDTQVFIRSLASRGHLGGLALAASGVIAVLDAAGMDVILVETVGIGQSEVEIAQLTQFQVVVLQPGTGDDIQTLKAGVLEIGDLLVINKSDLPGAERTRLDLLQMLALRKRSESEIPICKTIATTGEGIGELVQILLDSQLQSKADKPAQQLAEIQALLAHATSNEVNRKLQLDHSPQINRLCRQIQAADISLQQAATELAARVTAAWQQ
jgi:LAO/AO transport system kinase